MYIKVLSVRLFACGSAIIGGDLLVSTALSNAMGAWEEHNRRQRKSPWWASSVFLERGQTSAAAIASLALNWTHSHQTPLGAPLTGGFQL